MLLYEISLYTESKKDFVNPLDDGLKHYTRKDRRCKGPEEKYMDIPVNCNKNPSGISRRGLSLISRPDSNGPVPEAIRPDRFGRSCCGRSYG